MQCVLCESLQRTFEARQKEYIETASLACYRVSTKFAAYRNVEMERARLELQEHQAACVAAANQAGRVPVGALLRQSPREARRTTHDQAAA